MDLAQRIRVVLGILVLFVLGALLFAFLLTAFAVVLAIGAIFAIVTYVRLRLFARRVRRALEQEMARQGQAPPAPRGNGVVDADFKVEK
jgi:hypothetical protein